MDRRGDEQRPNGPAVREKLIPDSVSTGEATAMLKGLIYVDRLKINDLENRDSDQHYVLVCRNFWKEFPTVIVADLGHELDFFEEFNILNDQIFHQLCEKKCLNLEIWCTTKENRDFMDFVTNHVLVMRQDQNSKYKDFTRLSADNYIRAPFGVAQIPLHPFFVAYRNLGMSYRMSQSPLPVISTNTFLPILSTDTDDIQGALKCLFAIGTERQVQRLKEDRRLLTKKMASNTFFVLTKTEIYPYKDFYGNRIINKKFDAILDSELFTPADIANNGCGLKFMRVEETQDGQKVSTEIGGLSLVQTLKEEKVEGDYNSIRSFKMFLTIKHAINLPMHRYGRPKKKSSKKKSFNVSRYFPEDPPTTYVTFQAQNATGKTYKSPDGPVYASSLCEKTTDPMWNETFFMRVSSDYIFDSEKTFLVKVWKKISEENPDEFYLPSPSRDAVIGVVPLKLQAFREGVYINSALPVFDYENRIVGKLHLQAYPIDDFFVKLHIARDKYILQEIRRNPSLHRDVGQMTIPGLINRIPSQPSQLANGASSKAKCPIPYYDDKSELVVEMCNIFSTMKGKRLGEDTEWKTIEETFGFNGLNINEAIKKQTTELQKIADTLKARLTEVTGPLAQVKQEDLDNFLPFDEWCTKYRDDELTQFEKDLNEPPTPPVRQHPEPLADNTEKAKKKKKYQKKQKNE